MSFHNPSINNEGFIKLADFLDTIPDKLRKEPTCKPRPIFNMGVWSNLYRMYDHYDSEKGDIYGPVVIRHLGNITPIFNGDFDCGFAGCAMGWAVHAKLFEGLDFDEDGDIVFKLPDDVELESFEAVAHVFNTTYAVAKELFNANYDYNPKQVSAKIRHFVKTGQFLKWEDLRGYANAAVQAEEVQGTEADLG